MKKARIIDTQGHKDKKPIEKDLVPTLRAESHGNLPMVIFPERDMEDKTTYLERRYKAFIEKMRCFPQVFDAYNARDCGYIHPTLTAHSYQSSGSTGTVWLTDGGNDCMKIRTATKEGFEEAYPGDGINLSFPNSETRRGRVQSGGASTLQCNDSQGTLTKDMRIRKLTPKECFRLQGWTDDYFEKAAFVNNDSQLYKQAGNGVTVNVIYEIAKLLK